MSTSTKKVLSIVSMSLAMVLSIAMLVACFFPIITIDAYAVPYQERYQTGRLTQNAPDKAELQIGWGTLIRVLGDMDDLRWVIENNSSYDPTEPVPAISDADRARINEKLTDEDFLNALMLYYAAMGYMDTLLEGRSSDAETLADYEDEFKKQYADVRQTAEELMASADGGWSDEQLYDHYLNADRGIDSSSLEALSETSLSGPLWMVSCICCVMVALGLLLLLINMVIVPLVLFITCLRRLVALLRGCKTPTGESVSIMMSGRSLVGKIAPFFTAWVFLTVGTSGGAHMGGGFVAMLIMAALYIAIRLAWAFIEPTESPVRVAVKQGVSVITCVLALCILMLAVDLCAPMSYQGSMEAYADACYEAGGEMYQEHVARYREGSGADLHAEEMLPSHRAMIQTAQTLNWQIGADIIAYAILAAIVFPLLLLILTKSFVKLFDRAGMQTKQARQGQTTPYGPKCMSGIVALVLLIAFSSVAVSTPEARDEVYQNHADGQTPLVLLLNEGRAELRAREGENWREAVEEFLEEQEQELEELAEQLDLHVAEDRMVYMDYEQMLLQERRMLDWYTTDQAGALKALFVLLTIFIILELGYYIAPRFIPADLLFTPSEPLPTTEGSESPDDPDALAPPSADADDAAMADPDTPLTEAPPTEETAPDIVPDSTPDEAPEVMTYDEPMLDASETPPVYDLDTSNEWKIAPEGNGYFSYDDIEAYAPDAEVATDEAGWESPAEWFDEPRGE